MKTLYYIAHVLNNNPNTITVNVYKIKKNKPERVYSTYIDFNREVAFTKQVEEDIRKNCPSTVEATLIRLY